MLVVAGVGKDEAGVVGKDRGRGEFVQIAKDFQGLDAPQRVGEVGRGGNLLNGSGGRGDPVR